MQTSEFLDNQLTTPLLPLPWHYRFLRRWEVKRETVAQRLIPAGGKLLDIGCGDGTLALASTRTFEHVVALDLAISALERGRNQALSAGVAGRVHWVLLDCNSRLSFADQSFDAVSSLSMLQYVIDPEALLAEMFRVLKPGGYLLVEVPNMAYLPQRLRLLMGRPLCTSYYRHGIDGGNLHYFTVRMLNRLLRLAGLQPMRITGSGVFAPLRTWWTSLLCGNMFILARKPLGGIGGA